MKIESRIVGKGKHAVTLRREDGGMAWADELVPANAGQRKRFIEAAREKLPAIDPEWLEGQLLALADRPEAQDDDDGDDDGSEEIPEDPPEIRAEALEMLGSGDLMDEIRAGLGACGLACDLDLGMIIYLSMTSRLLPEPVCIFVQGPSSTGKTFIGRVVSGLMPPEEVVNAQDITPQVLYHMGTQLRRRILLMGEWCRSEEQSENGIRTQALRQLISDKRITKLYTNTESGKPVSEKATTEGPVAAYATSTLMVSEIFEEDENRFLFIHTDETEQATRLVMQRKAETAAGVGQASAAQLDRIRQRHHAMQREIRRQAAPVVIPFAEEIARRFPADQARRRRDIDRLFDLVRASALLHHQQRPRDDDGRIVAQLEDYRIIHELLVRFMVTSGPSEAVVRRYDELAAKLGPRGSFKRVEAEEIWNLKPKQTNQLIRQLKEARLCEDDADAKWTYRLRESSGERTSFLPDPSTLAP
jgi:hypothetical protein